MDGGLPIKDKGSDALLRELERMPRVGYIRDVNRGTLGWDLHFARERKLEDGGRQIVLATDRPRIENFSSEPVRLTEVTSDRAATRSSQR